MTATVSPLPLASPRAGSLARGRLVARATRGVTSLAEAHASSPLRYVVPTFPSQGAGRSVCLVTFGGGLVDGDRIELDVVVEEGATLVLFTQASTKVFRGSSVQLLRARVDGTLVVLLDPVACFGGARFEGLTEVVLGERGTCVVLDGFTSGRPAYGERWAMDRLALRTRVTRGGVRALDDAVVLDVAHAPILPRVAPYDAFVTVSAVGARSAPIRQALLEPPVRRRDVIVAPSRLSATDGAIVRIAAERPDAALAEARRRLRNLPDIDAVDTFASRR